MLIELMNESMLLNGNKSNTIELKLKLNNDTIQNPRYFNISKINHESAFTYKLFRIEKLLISIEYEENSRTQLVHQ